MQQNRFFGGFFGYHQKFLKKWEIWKNKINVAKNDLGIIF